MCFKCIVIYELFICVYELTTSLAKSCMMKIELTSEEQILENTLKGYDVLEWEEMGIQQRLKNAKQLMELLIERNAIPQYRVDYFIEPEYYVSKTKGSRRDNFKKNMRNQDEMFSNPHFLKYLQYFIYGPKLPETIVASFRSLKENYYYGDDVAEKVYPIIAKYLRSSSDLKSKDLAEEALKMMLELGYSISDALILRSKIMKVR